MTGLNANIDILRSKKILPVIFGATASGKTALSLAVSEILPCEVISADSRQIYKRMSIGTAKPAPEETSKVPHHFIDFLEPDETYSAGKFGDSAEITVCEIYSRGKLPIVVGGSGLYIKSLCEGFFDDDNTDCSRAREQLVAEFDLSGIESLYDELTAVDPESAKLYADKNPRRIIRALEYFRTVGLPLSTAHRDFDKKRDFVPIYFVIDRPREELYRRINLRVDIMRAQGLTDEVKGLLSSGYDTDLNSLNTVGYKEIISYLRGNSDEDSAYEDIKKNTRHYAKRQMTWFRRYESAVKLDGENQAEKFVEALKSTLLSTIHRMIDKR